jgi:hypothetical protein
MLEDGTDVGDSALRIGFLSALLGSWLMWTGLTIAKAHAITFDRMRRSIASGTHVVLVIKAKLVLSG